MNSSSRNRRLVPRLGRGAARAWIGLAGAAFLLSSLAATAAELNLDFGRMPPGPPPAEFRSALTGGGAPGDWQLIQVTASSRLPSLTGLGDSQTRETVLSQQAADPTDERFPLLIYDGQEFGDFTATLTFRTVGGKVERMAGLAFRLQNETNYYVIRASALGNTFRFYKVVDGVRSEPLGADVRVSSDEWHTLEVKAEGNRITGRLDDRELIPTLTDTSFTKGRLALWTKSDSVSHFRSLHVDFDPVRTLPQRLVERALAEYPRLKGVTVFALENGRVVAVASSETEAVGQAGTASEIRALESLQISAGQAADHSAAVFPLTDRNGDPLFAVRFKMRTFRGQTDNNIAARGKILADFLQNLVRTAEVGR